MRALWRGFDWKMPIFCPKSQFLAGSSHAAAIKKYKGLVTYYALFGQLASRRVRRTKGRLGVSEYCRYQIEQLGVFKTGLPGCMVTVWSAYRFDFKSHTKNNFLCVDPLTLLRVFLDASRHSAFTHVVCFF